MEQLYCRGIKDDGTECCEPLKRDENPSGFCDEHENQCSDYADY